MIRAIIVEDEVKSLSVIKNLVEKYAKNTIEIIGEADSIESAYLLILSLKPELLFLDIELKDGSSFSLLKKFTNPSFHIIFTTAFDRFAIKAFKFSAIDYLLKPIDDDEFKEAIERLLHFKKNAQSIDQSLSNVQAIYSEPKDIYNNKLALRNTDSIIFESLQNIIALTAEKNYTTIICKDNTRLSTKNLGYYDELLCSMKHFFRIHHSTIVNLDYIKELRNSKNSVSASLIMAGGHEFTVSTRRVAELKAAMNL